jgi:hypothetical protein
MIMATAHSTSKGRSGRNRPSKRGAASHRRQPAKQNHKKPRISDGRTGVRIRGRLREFLQSEQGFLLKAESLLLCIAKSMEDSSHPCAGPYYPDVVELAADLVKRRSVKLDELLLDGCIEADKAVFVG